MSAGAGMAEKVHPVVRVFCFITFAFFLALGSPAQLGVGTLLIVALYARSGRTALNKAWPMLRRMRWFFLSIFLLYLFISPGESPVDSGTWNLSFAGIGLALHRVFVLVVMVLAVCWLLHNSKREELVSALYRIVWPLTWLGLSRERFAVRTVLALESIDGAQYSVTERAKQAIKGDAVMSAYADAASNAFNDVLKQADEQPLREVELDVSTTPAVVQWGWLFLVAGLMLLPNLF